MSVAGKILPPNGFLGRRGVVSFKSMEAFSVITKEKTRSQKGCRDYRGKFTSETISCYVKKMKRLTQKNRKAFFRVFVYKNECTQHCVVECRVRFMYETPTAMYNMTRLHKVSERFTRLEIKVGPYFLETPLVLLDEKK